MMASRVESACVFCKQHEADPDVVGETYHKDGITVHQFCLYFASGLFQRGSNEEGINGFLIADILNEVARGNRKGMVCTVCKEKRATIGCSMKTCQRRGHFPCLHRAGFLFQYKDTFETFCPVHCPTQPPILPPLQSPGVQTFSCCICLCPIASLPSFAVIYCPNCSTFLHRECVQKQARSAGCYFFKCPVCGDKEVFVKEMIRMGIDVPQRDAEWESDGQFYGMYEDRKDCQAKVCLCPHGRGFSIRLGKYRMRKCNMCGQCFGHVECTRGKPNQCNDCSLPNPTQHALQVAQEEERVEDSGIEASIPPIEQETEAKPKKEEVAIAHPGPQRTNTAEISERALPSCATLERSERTTKGKSQGRLLADAGSEDSDEVKCSCTICRARKGSNCSDSTSETEDYQTTTADDYSGKPAQSAKEAKQSSQPKLKSKPLGQNCTPTSTVRRSMRVTSALTSAAPDSVSSRAGNSTQIDPELYCVTPSPPLSSSPPHSCSPSPSMLTPLSAEQEVLLQSPLVFSLSRRLPFTDLSSDSGTKSDSSSHVHTPSSPSPNRRKSPYPRRLSSLSRDSQPQESASVFEPGSTHSHNNSKELQRKRTPTSSSETLPAAKKPKSSSSQASTSGSQNKRVCRRIIPMANLVRSPINRKEPCSLSSSRDSEEADHSSCASTGTLDHLVHRNVHAANCETEHVVPTSTSAHSQTETHIPTSTKRGNTAQLTKKNTQIDKKEVVIIVGRRIDSTTHCSGKVVDVQYARWLTPRLTRTLPYKKLGLRRNMHTPKNGGPFLSSLVCSVHQAES